MGVFDRFHRRPDRPEGEPAAAVDQAAPAWIVSLVVHVVVLLGLALAGWQPPLVVPQRITVLDTSAEPEPEIIEILEEIEVSDEPATEVGGEPDRGIGDAASVAPLPAVESIVHVDLPEIDVDAPEVEPNAALSAEAFIEPISSIGGEQGIGEARVAGAVDRLTREIVASLDQRPTLVCWVFDQSVSLAGQRKEIAGRLSRVFDELGVTATGRINELNNLVFAYGKEVTVVTPAPTEDVSRVVAAIESIPIDESGIEMTFTAIGIAARQADKASIPGGRKNVIVIAFTDEVGNDQQFVDQVAEFCRRHAIRVFVVGVPAPFGQQSVRFKFVEFDPRYQSTEQWAKVDQGPETFYPEVVQVRPKDAPDEPIDSGFGPFSLSRLCAETGGVYFAVHANREAKGRVRDGAVAPMSAALRYFFDPAVMRAYAPDYLSTAELDKRIRANAAKQALVNAARAAELNPLEGPRMEFPREDDGRLVGLLSEAQKQAAVLEPKITRLHGILQTGRGDRPKIKPDEKRWQAGYDLAMGRVLAAKVRTEAYNGMLAYAKRGMTFKDPKSDTWRLVPSDEVAMSQVGAQVSKQADEAREFLNRVVTDHPGTPWATIAAGELATPLSYEWQEAHTGVNTPKPSGGGGGNPNRGDDQKRMLAPPKPKRPIRNL
jgi:hypothetical protein